MDAPSLSNQLRAVLRKRTTTPSDNTILRLSVLLVVGLAIATPILALATRPLGVPPIVSLSAGLALTALVYIAVAVHLRELLPATAIAVLVLSTFSANVPLLSGATDYPGTIGPQVVLVQPALLALVALLIANGAYHRHSVPRIELAFGLFVAWSFLSAIVGNPPRQDTALYCSIALLTPLLGIGALYRAVRERVLALPQVCLALIVALAGHSAWALAQLVNSGPFGLTYLGETGRSGVASTMTLPIVGEFSTGLFVSGFTGGNSPYSILAALVIPVVASFALDGDRSRAARSTAGVVTAVMALLLRTTDKDATRGALVIGLIVMAIVYLWWSIRSNRTTDTGWSDDVIASVSALVFPVVAILLPSSTSSGTSNYAASVSTKTTSQSSTAVTTSTATTSSASTTSSTPSVTTTTQTTTPASTTTSGANSGGGIKSVSVPLFDLQTLGLRIQQYVAGLDIAWTHPLFGIGGANYPYIAPKYGLPKTLGSGLFPLHNQYIAVLAETGVPGFLAFMAAVACTLVALWRAVERDEYGILAVGLAGGIAAYLAAIFWDVNVRYVMVVPFWLLAGAVVATDHSDATSEVAD